MVEKADEVLADFLLSSVEEQNNILVGRHSLLVVFSCEFFFFGRLFGLPISRPFILFNFFNKLIEGLLSMRGRGNKRGLCLPINGDNVLLIMYGEGSQGRLILRVIGAQLHKHEVVVSLGDCREELGVLGVFGGVDVNDGKLLFVVRYKILLRKILTQGYSPRLSTRANTFFIVVYIS